MTDCLKDITPAKRDAIYAIISAVYNVYQASLKTCENLLHKHLDNKVRLDVQHIHFALLILGNGGHANNIYNQLNNSAQKFINHKKDYGGGKHYNFDNVLVFLQLEFDKIDGKCPAMTEDFILFWCSILDPIQV